MSEDKARSLGYTPLGIIKSYAYAALDPGEQCCRAVLAAPVALKRAGMTLKGHRPSSRDILRHSRRRCFRISGLRVEEVGRARRVLPAVGASTEQAQREGGSIAMGIHSERRGAITTTLIKRAAPARRAVRAHDGCAAGGMGFAMVVERTR